jgi:sucrose-6-phosphate hydrolase SacC (GH32 family)
MVQDKFRPRYHFLPPEGRWNDINGAVFYKGQYHIGYLQKISHGRGIRDFSSWQHISSRDLLHWRYHQASLREPLEGLYGDYFNSGDVMEGTEVPTIITNMPRHGIVVYQSFGDKHMLLMHSHRPYFKAQYYLGRYENEQFHPEIHGQLSWLGSLLSGPETLVDDQGRRIFWGWVSDARQKGDDRGWQSIMTLPWHFSPAEDNTLLIDPVEELRALRYDERRHADMALVKGEEVVVKGFDGDCMEIKLRLEPEDAIRFGLKLLCSPNLEEETVVTYDMQKQQFVIDFEKASESEIEYSIPGHKKLTKGSLRQVVPFPLQDDGVLGLDIFVDRSVIEIFVNSRICLVQRVYPLRDDSRQFRLFSEGGKVRASELYKWEMDATNPW